jgi:hypothetical protein
VENNNFTGQIAFDFIETPDGRLCALECNPRATSGVHLLASNPNFIEAFLNPNIICINPAKDRSSMFAIAMLFYGFIGAFKKNKLGNWFSTFFTSKDVIFDIKDPLPFLLQFRSIFAYLKTSREQKISPMEASTFDIEWDGG